MFYEMKKDESVSSILDYSGGFTGDAYKKNIRLVRKSGREYSIHTIDEFDMSAFQLNDGDSLFVDSVVPRFSNMVEIKGAVFHPGMFQMDGKVKLFMKKMVLMLRKRLLVECLIDKNLCD